MQKKRQVEQAGNREQGTGLLGQRSLTTCTREVGAADISRIPKRPATDQDELMRP